MLVQAAFIMSGLVTLFQSHPLFGKLGSGLPVIMGSAFAYVPTLTSIGAQFGIGAILGAFIGGVPTTAYGQNVGIVTTNRVVNRAVFTAAACVLVVAGLAPKFAAVLSGIPQAVIGGATVTVFGSIAMTGIRMLTQGGLGPRKSTIAGLSLALGMGIAMTEGALTGEGMPLWVGELFGNSAIVITTLCAIVLNLILPKPPEDNVAVQAAEEASEALEELKRSYATPPRKAKNQMPLCSRRRKIGRKARNSSLVARAALMSGKSTLTCQIVT